MGDFFSNINWGLIILSILLGLAIGLFITMRREAKKSVTLLSEDEFVTNMRKGQLIDLRKKDEFERGHINGARNIPAVTLTRDIGKLRADLPVYLYCENGKSCKRSVLLLSSKGFKDIYQLEGGLENFSGALKTKKQK